MEHLAGFDGVVEEGGDAGDVVEMSRTSLLGLVEGWLEGGDGGGLGGAADGEGVHAGHFERGVRLGGVLQEFFEAGEDFGVAGLWDSRANEWIVSGWGGLPEGVHGVGEVGEFLLGAVDDQCG